MPILIQQDVAGLEVQVQDVGSMQLCQPLQNLQGNGDQLMQAQGTCILGKTLYQCSTIKTSSKTRFLPEDQIMVKDALLFECSLCSNLLRDLCDGFDNEHSKSYRW